MLARLQCKTELARYVAAQRVASLVRDPRGKAQTHGLCHRLSIDGEHPAGRRKLKRHLRACARQLVVTLHRRRIVGKHQRVRAHLVTATGDTELMYAPRGVKSKRSLAGNCAVMYHLGRGRIRADLDTARDRRERQGESAPFPPRSSCNDRDAGTR